MFIFALCLSDYKMFPQIFCLTLPKKVLRINICGSKINIFFHCSRFDPAFDISVHWSASIVGFLLLIHHAASLSYIWQNLCMTFFSDIVSKANPMQHIWFPAIIFFLHLYSKKGDKLVNQMHILCCRTILLIQYLQQRCHQCSIWINEDQWNQSLLLAVFYVICNILDIIALFCQ